jgi:predicted dehydrogenase
MADSELSVGFFMGYGCHQLDMTFGLLNTKAKTVFAKFGNYWAQTPIENCGMMFITFENGAYTTFWELCSMPKETKQWPPFPDFHEINEIVFEKGMMILRPYQKLMIRKNGEWQTVIELSPKEADPISVFLKEEAEGLAKAIINNTEPPVTGEDGKHTVEVIVAAYRSSLEDKSFSLPLAKGGTK